MTRRATSARCPVSGIDADEVVDAFPVAQAISAFFTGNREYANLPRKFKIAVTGCTEDCARVEINDIGLWPAERSTTAPSASTCSSAAASPTASAWRRTSTSSSRPTRRSSCAGAWPSSSASWATGRTAAWPACATWPRSSAQRASAPRWTSARASPSSRPGEELTTRFRGDHVGVHPQKQDGLVYVGCSVPVGRMHGIELIELARLAETYGDGDVRIGTDQNFVISGVPEDRVDDLLAERLLQTYSPVPRTVRAGRRRLHRLGVLPLRRRRDQGTRRQVGPGARCASSPQGDQRDAGVIRMHFSGCSASCAQPQIADIGFRGDIAHVDEHIEEAVDIGLGGSLGPDAAFIDWVTGAMPVDRGARRARARRRALPRRAPSGRSLLPVGPPQQRPRISA